MTTLKNLINAFTEMAKFQASNHIYRLFFLRSIAQFFTQIYMNCFVSS